MQWNTVAHLENGRYTFTVDVPEGLLCGGYYGSSVVPLRHLEMRDYHTESVGRRQPRCVSGIMDVAMPPNLDSRANS